MRIVSVATTGGEEILYPYRTIRKIPASFPMITKDTVMGSWLGGRVVRQNDGTFLFDNYFGDTVVIRTAGDVGDTWMFYTDTTSVFYTASVTTIEEMTVLGVPDSVKTITLHAFDSGLSNPLDPLDNFEFKISKNHGFVRIFDLYTFPYRFTDEVDFFYKQSLTSLTAGYFYSTAGMYFDLIDFQNPTASSIFDFSPGDVFETKTTSTSAGAIGYRYTHYSGYKLDSILSVHSPDAFHKVYVRKVVEAKHEYTDYTPGSIDVGTIVTDTLTVDTSVLFPDLRNYMPEEYFLRPYQIYYYLPGDASCISTPLYAVFPFGVGFPGAIRKIIYKQKLGEIYLERAFEHTFGSGFEGHIATVVYNTQIYAKTSGVECGTYETVPILVDDPKLGASIELFPNPAVSLLNISSSEEISELSFVNVLGQVCLHLDCHDKQARVDISGLPAGVYSVSVNRSRWLRFVKHN
jgi:hypothetical protein